MGYQIIYDGDDREPLVAICRRAALGRWVIDVEHDDADAPAAGDVVAVALRPGLLGEELLVHPFDEEVGGPDPAADPFAVPIAAITALHIY